jgi:hypothetical protein
MTKRKPPSLISRKSTYGRRNLIPEPAAPCLFETFLDSIGVDESNIPRDEKIVSWIRENCYRHFVPEDLLKELGIDLSALESYSPDLHAPSLADPRHSLRKIKHS